MLMNYGDKQASNYSRFLRVASFLLFFYHNYGEGKLNDYCAR